MMNSSHIKTRTETKGRPRGFTLVELLVVISIIAVLLTILIPALQVAKQQATGVVCLANQRTLSLAYTMYSDDNNGQLVGSYCMPLGSAAPYRDPWICPPTTADGTLLQAGSPTGEGGDPATLEDRLRGLREGKLFPYVESTDAYHCPGDKRMYEGTYFGDSLVYKMYRTYSIQLGLNCGWSKSLSRMSAIEHPEETYVFVEEYYDGWTTNYNGGFILDPINLPGYWWSVIAIWHNDVGTLGYADGHAERRKWVDERTIDLEYSRSNAYQPDNPDLEYMIRHYAIKGDMSWYQP